MSHQGGRGAPGPCLREGGPASSGALTVPSVTPCMARAPAPAATRITARARSWGGWKAASSRRGLGPGHRRPRPSAPGTDTQEDTLLPRKGPPSGFSGGSLGATSTPPPTFRGGHTRGGVGTPTSFLEVGGTLGGRPGRRPLPTGPLAGAGSSWDPHLPPAQGARGGHRRGAGGTGRRPSQT